VNLCVLLGEITSSINHMRNGGLGYYASPADINDKAYDPYIRELRGLIRYSSDKKFKKPSQESFKAGDYVYLDYPPRPLMKGVYWKCNLSY
jgi:hypothetical protein